MAPARSRRIHCFVVDVEGASAARLFRVRRLPVHADQQIVGRDFERADQPDDGVDARRPLASLKLISVE
jgi:hypothetical protein